MTKRASPTTLQEAMQASEDRSAEREREDGTVVTVFGLRNGTFQVKIQTGEVFSPVATENSCKTFDDVLTVLSHEDSTAHDWLPWPVL